VSELDWAQLQKEADGAKALPEQDYSMICIESDAVTSSNGKPMIKTRWRITEGPHVDKKVGTQFVVSAESAVALKIFFQQMAALGLTADYFASNPKMPEVANALRGRVAVVTLGIRAWQGVDRNEFKAIRAFPEGVPLPPGAVTGTPTRIGMAAGGAPSPLTSAPGSPPSPVAAAAPTPAVTPAAPSAPPSSPF